MKANLQAIDEMLGKDKPKPPVLPSVPLAADADRRERLRKFFDGIHAEKASTENRRMVIEELLNPPM